MKRSLTALSLLVLIACNKSNKDISQSPDDKIVISPAEYNSIFVKPGDQISKNEMVKLVNKFADQATEKKATTKSTASLKAIGIKPFRPQTKSSASSEAAIPLYNIIAVNSTGDSTSSVISADARLPLLLAYTNGGKDLSSGGTPEGVQLLINAALSSYKDKLAATDKMNDSIRKEAVAKIASKLSIAQSELTLSQIKSSVAVQPDIIVKSPIMQDPEATYPQFYVVNRYLPFLETAWSQGMPYNRLMPQSCPDNWLWDYRYAIPSSAIAIAQVMAFYQPNVTMNGTTMDWFYLTENKEIHEDSDYFGGWVQDPLARRNMVAELMKGIIQECNISYTCTTSSMTVTPVKNYLATYQITMGAETGFWWDPIRNSVADLKPALLYGQTDAGEGHFMVVDGGMLMKSSPTSTINFNVVHVNMCMGEAYNGYYMMGDYKLEPGFATFTKNWKLLPEITRDYTN